MYNKKVLSTATKKLGKAKAPVATKDIIVDPKGQWKYPGQVTRIPASDITMQGVNYPVFAQPNVGQPQMMYPGQEYQFPGADYVDEFPQGDSNDYIEADLTDEEIAEYAKGGFIIEDISVPHLSQAKQGGALLTKKVTCKKCGWTWDAADGGNDMTTCHKCGGQGLIHAQNGGQYTYGDRNYKKDSKGNWSVAVKGVWTPLSKNVEARTKELNKNAKPIVSTVKSPELQNRRYDPMYNPGFNKAFVAESTAVNKVQPKYIPTVQEQMAADKRAVTKNITDKNKKVKEYYKEYHESPRYTEMLQQSSPNNWMDYYLGRNENLEDPHVYIRHKQPFDEPNTGGFSSNETGDITVLPKGFNVKGLLPHEWSHSIDRPLNPWSINSYTNRLYNLGNNYNMRLIPGKDQQWMKTHRANDWYHSPAFQKLSPGEKKYEWFNVSDPWHKANAKQQKEWLDYVGTDTETRARLNDIRYHSKKRGIYDPFTEKVSPSIYKNLLKTKFETGKEEGFDALKQLKDVYTDEEIQWMLNNISQNQEEDQEDIEQGVARRGGSLKKYSRSLEATNKLFRESPLLKKVKSKKKKIFDPNSKYYQDGGASSPEEWGQQIKDIEGQIGNPANWTMDDYYLLQDKLNTYKDWRENTPEGQAVNDSHNEEGEYNIPLPEHLQDYTNAMMKSKLAYANEFGNPAAKRMITLPDNPYQFDSGDTGTHYMASMDNYAVPQIQDENGELMLGDYGPDSREAMRFDSDEDANYFAEHYKDVSPGFIEADLTPKEIEEYAKGGYIIEELPRAQLGQNVKNDSGYRTSTEALQGLIKQRDSDLSYAKTPAHKAEVNKRYDKLIADATFRQNVAYKNASTAGTKQVKNIITTSDKAKQIKADKIAKEKAEAEYYAAELAKNNGEVPDSKYAYLDERAAPVADNTRVDPSYLPFAQQETKFANQAQDEEERQQEDDYRTGLAFTKNAQKQGYKNTYDQKYNPKPVVPTWTERNKLGYDDPNANMHSGAAGSADWFWTLPLAIPAAIEGLGALAGTALGSAAEAAFAIDGANMIYEGRNALEIANAMPENTYEQKIAKLDAQNEAYGSMSLGALDAVPFGIGKLRQANKLTNLTKARTASSEVALAKSPLQKFIGNTGATAETVAKNAELQSTRTFAGGKEELLQEDDVLSQYYKEQAMSELNGQQDMYDYGEDLYDYNDWDDYDPFNGATEDELNNALAPGDDDIDNPFAGIAQNDLDDMFARLETPAVKSNQLPAPPNELNLPGLDAAPPSLVPSNMELNTQRNILTNKYNSHMSEENRIRLNEDPVRRAYVDALRDEIANVDQQLRTIRQQRVDNLNATPGTNAPQVLGQIDLTRPNNYSTPVPDPAQVQRNNPFPGLRGEREVTTAPLRRNTMYDLSTPIPDTGMTIRETLAQHDNPLNVVNEIRTIAQRNIVSPGTTTDLMEAVRTEIRKMPIASDAKKFLIKEAKRISNVPKTTPYTGSTVSEEEFFSFFHGIPEAERVAILDQYGYTPGDLMDLERRYDNNDTVMSITMNQVYDDLKYMINHDMPNPNTHVVNIKTGDLSPVLKKQTELYNSGVSKKALKKIEDTVYVNASTKQTTGVVSYSRVDDPTIHTLKDTKIIPKTKDLDDLIESYEEAIGKLQDGILKDDLTTQLEDYKSTKWLRTEYAAELKQNGLNPNKIEKASVISNTSGQKNLVDEDGNVIGTLNAYKSSTNENVPGFKIGSTGVNYKFHPYPVGTKHSKFKDWDEASEHFQNQLLSDKLLSVTSEADRNNPIMLKHFRRQAKVEAEDLIKQLKENNNNRWGEALYRGVHHGVKDTKGAVFTEQSFAPTTLPDAITKEPIDRYRAQDYWNSQAKQINDMGIPKAEFVIAPPGSSRAFSEEQIIIRRKQGGNLDKLNKFIR